jgi:hypothetical protein
LGKSHKEDAVTPNLSAVATSAASAATRFARAKTPATDLIQFVEDAPSRESALKEIDTLLSRVRALPDADAAPADTSALTTREAPFAVYAATIARSFVATPAAENSIFAQGAASGGASARQAQAAYAEAAADAAPTPAEAGGAPTVLEQALADVSRARAEIDASLRRYGP